MSMRAQMICWALLTLAVCSHAFAQQGKVVFVEVDHVGTDSVGTRLTYEVREIIRGSKGMRLADDMSAPRIRLALATVDVDRNDVGLQSAIGVSIVFDAPDIPLDGALMLTSVHVCGRNVAASCARGIVSKIDRELDRLRTKWPSLWKRL